jgi:uncharacterized protein
MLEAAMNSAILEKPIALRAFFGLAFAWSWLFWILSYLTHPKSTTLATALTCLGSFGPSLAAVAVVRSMGGPLVFRQWLRQCLRCRVGWQWFALAMLLPLVVMSGVALAYRALGGILVYSLSGLQVLIAPLIFVGVFFAGGPLGEEFGWRGYALPILKKRYGWRVASIVIGVVWGSWHVPLFYLANTTQSQTTLAIFMSMIVAYSVVFAWFFNQSGQSLMPVLALHTAFNAWAFIIPTLPSPRGQRPADIAVGIFVAIAIGLLLKPDRSLGRNWLRINKRNWKAEEH